MPGRGVAPKPAHKRARRNVDPIPATVLPFVAGDPPRLPAKRPDGSRWPAQTRAWWAMWGRAPQAVLFTESDWSELLDTALLHAALWSGNLNVAAELRLRVAKHGATTEDRARLRITFAQADEADAKRPAPVGRARYEALRVIDVEESDAVAAELAG